VAVRHLAAPRDRAIRSSPGVEGHVQQDGNGGQGTVLAQQAERLRHARYLRVLRVDIQGGNVGFG
jgi:hypothetical protein